MEVPTEAKRAAWAAKIASAPEEIRVVAERFDPWARYRMADTGQIVRIDSFDPDGTLLVYIDPEFNDTRDPRTGCQVFGINPDDLKPWPPLN